MKIKYLNNIMGPNNIYNGIALIDNYNDKLINKNKFTVDLVRKEIDIDKQINILEGKEKNINNNIGANLKKILYEINFLKAAKNSLNELQASIKEGGEVDIKTIDKYYLSLYTPENLGISCKYQDISSLGLTKIIKYGFEITGYIKYGDKNLVIIDDPNGNKYDKKSDKKIYSIDLNGELKEERNFYIEGFKIINNLGEQTNNNKKNNNKIIIDQEIEEILKNKLEERKIGEKAANILLKISKNFNKDNDLSFERLKLTNLFLLVDNDYIFNKTNLETIIDILNKEEINELQKEIIRIKKFLEKIGGETSEKLNMKFNFINKELNNTKISKVLKDIK